MNKNSFQIGDLVAWKDDYFFDNMRYGIVVGFTKLFDWDCKYETVDVVIIHWNGDVTTNTSPNALRKL